MYFEVTYLKDGKRLKKVVEADNFLQAAKKFKQLKLGIFIKAQETTEPLSIKIEHLKKDIEKALDKSKINLEEYVAVLEQIYVMLDASLSLNDILGEVSENIKNKKLKEVLLQLNQDVQSGLNVSASLKKYEKEVGKLSISMIELGEQTGMLAEAFRDLAEILSEILENRKKLKSATRYPMFILFAMIIAFTVVILFVIPPFKSIFADLGADLPMPTKFLLWLEHFLRTFGPWIVALSVVFMVVTNYLYHKSKKVELKLVLLMLKYFLQYLNIYLYKNY